MPNTQSSKGNPAHVRMSNAQKKLIRSRSYNRGLVRAQARREAQHLPEAANLYARRLPQNEMAEITRRSEAGEKPALIAKDFGTTEYVITRLLTYGKMTPWQIAQVNRAIKRRPLRDAWEKKHNPKGNQLPAS